MLQLNILPTIVVLCSLFKPSLLFNYEIVDHTDFPYVIKKHNYTEQSPTNVITDNVQRLYDLPFLSCHFLSSFNTAMANFTNTGHTITVKLYGHPKDVPYIVGGPLFNHRYLFEQMHFHWGSGDHGSEHEINGKKYAMEVHMVLYKEKYGCFEKAQHYRDGVCVVAVFLKLSERDNPEMENFIRDLDELHEYKSSMIKEFVTEFAWINDVALNQYSYYSYHGSLTTDPFLECVIWILFTNPIPISRRQLKEFRELQTEDDKLIKTNDRELQSFNNRHVIYVQ